MLIFVVLDHFDVAGAIPYQLPSRQQYAEHAHRDSKKAVMDDERLWKRLEAKQERTLRGCERYYY
jgi:hypothetical protein